MHDKITNIYCDESHPNKNDGQSFMVIGAVICDKSKYRKIKKEIQQIKKANNLTLDYEFKWQKVNKKTYKAYYSLINFISNCPNIRVKINLALGKNILSFYNEEKYSYEDWYHNMYVHMLQNFLDKHRNICDENNFVLYIDKKDSHSCENYKKIATFLEKKNSKNSFVAYACDSKEFLLIQAIDVIIGAVSYHQKRNFVNKYKTDLMRHIGNKLNIDFVSPTPINSDKVSFFIWKPRIKKDVFTD